MLYITSGGAADRYRAREGMTIDQLRGLVDPTGSQRQHAEQMENP